MIKLEGCLFASGVDEKDMNCKIRYHFGGIIESVINLNLLLAIWNVKNFV